MHRLRHLMNPKTGLITPAGVVVALLLVSCLSSPTPVNAQNPPYPPSQLIAGVEFDWSTHVRLAPGSDNWAITWADDDHQYTTWGDGGGFGGTNSDGRVSLGFGRVEGPRDNYTGHNVWGGRETENRAAFGGKSYGILSVAGTLYAWRCGDASTTTAYNFQELYRSTDHGASWVLTDARFDQSSFPGDDRGFFCPTFLQFGQDYAGARDEYVYMYAPEIKTASWQVHKPGEITLIRVPLGSLGDPAQHEFFTGLDGDGSPAWTTGRADREPVFADPQNGVMMVSVSYNAGLGRYFLITQHSSDARGNIGIYEAPEPWGPWATVLFQKQFGSPAIDPNTFFWNFSNKWLSSDGKSFVLVFTGVKTSDGWHSVEGSFQLSAP